MKFKRRELAVAGERERERERERKLTASDSESVQSWKLEMSTYNN